MVGFLVPKFVCVPRHFFHTHGSLRRIGMHQAGVQSLASSFFWTPGHQGWGLEEALVIDVAFLNGRINIGKCGEINKQT